MVRFPAVSTQTPQLGHTRSDRMRPSKQTEGYGTDKSDGPEPQNGLLYCYEGTNITAERAVNPHKTQLIDALIEPYEGLEVPGAVNTLG